MNVKWHFFSVLLGLFLVVSWNASSQEIDVKTYIDLVREHNLDLEQEEQRIKLAEADTKIAKSLLLPNVSLEGFYQRDFTKNFLFINDEFDGSVTQFRTNFDNTIDLSATVSQVIFDPMAFSTVKMAKLAEVLTRLNTSDFNNKLVVEASKLYWQAIFIKESIKVLEENVLLAKEQFDQIKAMYHKGAASQLHYHQAEALYKKSIPSLNNANRQYENLLNELKVLAHIPMSESLILKDDLETIALNDVYEPQTMAFLNQPEIKAIKTEIEIIEQQIITKKKFWYPKLNLVAGYNYSGQDNEFQFSNNDNKLFFGQLRVEIPIFSGGRNHSEIKKSEIEKQTATLQLKQKQQTYLKEFQSVVNTYNSTINTMRVHEETIVLNEKEIEVYNKQLKLGVITPIEFKEVRLRLIQSKLDLLNDYLDLHICKLQIKRILGQGI